MSKLLILLLAVSVSCIKVDIESSLFVDQYGRSTVFHGVNVVMKTFPFYPQLDHFDSNYSLTEQDMENLQGWGFNMIRLHVAWEGVEPERGVYNYTYIEKLRQIVRMCNKYNIYVLLDAHQDLFNRQFCGEGFPDWTVKRDTFPFPLKVHMKYDQKGYPTMESCHQVEFALFYTTEDLNKFQQDFFTNKRGLLDHYTKMWEQVAVYMTQEPNLLGYEILNEPIGANGYKNLANVLEPGVSNNKFLLPAYQKIYAGIRKHDKRNLVFFEPSVIDVFGGGFFQTLGEESQKETQVFSYHVYCPDVTKTGEPVSQKVCSVFDQLEIASKELNVRNMKVGGFMTEFGALSDTLKSAEEVTVLTDEMSKYFRSWSYWQFKYYDDITTAARPGTTQSFYDDEGNLQENKVKALSRSYAYAICGSPISEEFKNEKYTFKWFVSHQCFNKNTEIFLSEGFHYPLGWQSKFSNNCKGCNLEQMAVKVGGYYKVVLSDKVREHEKVVLTISPKTK